MYVYTVQYTVYNIQYNVYNIYCIRIETGAKAEIHILK